MQEREEYLKNHNVKAISLVVSSYIDENTVGISYMCVERGSYILLSCDEDFKNNQKILPYEEFFSLKDYDNVVKEDNVFYECGLYSCKSQVKKDNQEKYYYKVIYN